MAAGGKRVWGAEHGVSDFFPPKIKGQSGLYRAFHEE
jgi:hypothetical protein